MLRKIITVFIIICIAVPLVILAMNYCGNCSKGDAPAANSEAPIEQPASEPATPTAAPAEVPAAK